MVCQITRKFALEHFKARTTIGQQDIPWGWPLPIPQNPKIHTELATKVSMNLFALPSKYVIQ
jgi:hypothetical protein